MHIKVGMSSRRRAFALAFLTTLVLFVGINLVAAHIRSDCGIAAALIGCADDIRRAGFPLLVWEEGGFAYRNIFHFTAWILDVGIGLTACTIMGLIGQLFVKDTVTTSRMA